MFWTDERVESLQELAADGLSASQIADKVGGGVARIDVIGKAENSDHVDHELGSRVTSLDRAKARSENATRDRSPFAFQIKRSIKEGNPLAIYLSIYTLDRLVRELLPFYGLDCPIAVVVDRDGSGTRLLRGTLATIEHRAETALNDRSMLVLVG